MINSSRTYNLALTEEDGQHKVFQQHNLVDTWHEFTPTGARDIEVACMSLIFSEQWSQVGIIPGRLGQSCRSTRS